MSKLSINLINNLQKEDQMKISYFVDLLLKKDKYKGLKKEIALRKREVKKGAVLTHEEIWSV